MQNPQSSFKSTDIFASKQKSKIHFPIYTKTNQLPHITQ